MYKKLLTLIFSVIWLSNTPSPPPVLAHTRIANHQSGNSVTYYVNRDHPQAQDNDSHGTIERPWKTIQYGIRQLQAGDTLIIRGGVYDEVPVYTRNGGTAAAPVTVRAYPGEIVVWHQQDNTLWHLITGQHWVIEDIIFEGRFILGNSSDEIAEHITFSNCRFQDSSIIAIRLFYARHILIDECRFVNLRSGIPGVDVNAVAIPRWGDDITIRNSRFEDIGSDGVHVGALGDQIGQVIIANNEFLVSGLRSPVGENGVDVKAVQGPIIITGNSFHGFRKTVEGQDASGAMGAGLVIHWPYVDGPPAQNVIVEGNLFYDNPIHLWIAGESENVTVKNNLFRDAYSDGTSDAPGIGVWVHNALDIDILHNTFSNNRLHIASGSDKVTTGSIQNNVFQQGGFQMPAPGGVVEWITDYNAWNSVWEGVPEILCGDHDLFTAELHLNENLCPVEQSPLIDAGIDVGVADDFIGAPRTDQHPDMGAYEYMDSFRAMPNLQIIDPGGVAKYTLHLYSATPITLSTSPPASNLQLALHPTVIAPGEMAILVLTDTHNGPSLVPGLWHTITITGASVNATLNTQVHLLIGGTRTHLPLIVGNHQ